MPGGYRADDHQNGGTPTLTRKYAFAAFIISDVLAFLCSIIATTWLMLAGSLATDPSRRVNLILRSGPLILIAVQSMIAAFALSVIMAASSSGKDSKEQTRMVSNEQNPGHLPSSGSLFGSICCHRCVIAVLFRQALVRI
uniref:PGG domain-containing protein n=1 Tax=Ananas comosus var. bracteatus TaxID=296719 RepID=A0A6V7PJN3_ANACO|nr:unnamed protein product [Ananas comosus var. bracteatus]